MDSTVSCMHVHLYTEFIQAVSPTIQSTVNQLRWPGFAVQLIVHLQSSTVWCQLHHWRFGYFDFECILGYFGVSIIHWFLTGITWFLRYVCDLFACIIYTHGRPWCIVSFKDCTHVVHAPKVTQILFLFMVTLPQDHCAQVNVKSWYFIVWECLLQYNSSCY